MIIDVLEKRYDEFIVMYPKARVVYGSVSGDDRASHLVFISKQYKDYLDNETVRYIVTETSQDDSRLIFIRKTKEFFVYTTVNQHPETQFMNIMYRIIHEGNVHDMERTGTGTVSLFNQSLSIDLLQGYIPIQDLRKTPRKMIYNELKWYLSGSTDVEELHKKGIHVWDGNTSKAFLQQQNLPYEEYDMGPTYGFQFRHAGAYYIGKGHDYTGQGVDQWNNLKHGLVTNPQSRRHIIQLYNVPQLKEMSLPPCLMMYQFYTTLIGEHKYYLDGIYYSRSSDIFLAGYWNLCQMFLIMQILSKEIQEEYNVKFIPRTIQWHIGDAHVYTHQLDQVKTLLSKKVTKYYRFKELMGDEIVLESEYTPQTTITSRMAV